MQEADYADVGISGMLYITGKIFKTWYIYFISVLVMFPTFWLFFKIMSLRISCNIYLKISLHVFVCKYSWFCIWLRSYVYHICPTEIREQPRVLVLTFDLVWDRILFPKAQTYVAAHGPLESLFYPHPSSVLEHWDCR